MTSSNLFKVGSCNGMMSDITTSLSIQNLTGQFQMKIQEINPYIGFGIYTAEQVPQRTVVLSMMWDIMTPLWRHWTIKMTFGVLYSLEFIWMKHDAKTIRLIDLPVGVGKITSLSIHNEDGFGQTFDILIASNKIDTLSHAAIQWLSIKKRKQK